MRVRLLGGFTVSVGDRRVARDRWRLRKASALVKLLALASGHRLHREQAMDLLWPDLGKKAASNNLRQALHAARKALGSASRARYLASEDDTLELCPEGDLWVDAEAFEEAAATARRGREPAAYRVALDLYAGDLLPEDRYEDWADGRREVLRGLYVALLVELASIHEERGDYGPGVERLRKTVAEEPINEEAHTGLMRLYARLGRQADALAQYERLEVSLSRELGSEPNASSRALREEIAAGRFPPSDRSVGPPEGEGSGPLRHNLPVPRTSFVGREREMLEIKRELAMTRLLTLTGAGGSGKTRLALEVARDLSGSYPDGVWLIELAPLTEGELVAQATLEALGLTERPGEPLTATLVDHLRGKQTLLVVDNCEHLVDAVARVVDLLDSCPHLRVLATGREALRVPGEVNWTVPNLSVPDSLSPSTVEGLETHESARLFARRARHRGRSFALTSANAGAVAEICRRLDGIPLAIELAAARVGTLSVEGIASRLADSLQLLTGGDRTATPRQRTIRGELDWSYGLLSDDEKSLFGRLAAFAGGWTLEAAEAVGSGAGIDEADVLDLLSSLVERSLVVLEATGDGRTRYKLLEPIRQYALAQLEESGGVVGARHRHAEYVVKLAEEAEPGFFGT